MIRNAFIAFIGSAALAACAAQERAGEAPQSRARSTQGAAPSDGVAAVEKPVLATGRIVAIDAEKRKITLDHAPIAEIGWSAMTMRFEAADGVDLTGLSAGDAVAFELESPTAPRRIVKIEKR